MSLFELGEDLEMPEGKLPSLPPGDTTLKRPDTVESQKHS
jgi:hypothetical protein